MKRILLSLLASSCFALAANAASGDTTTVQAHPLTSFLNYGNFDHPVTFPNGALNYRKINMTFTLGKETCPATEQYCAQWDYTVRIFVMTPTDTFELGRFITPYAHSSYPNMPLAWKHDYVFDVTDYYPILKNGAEMRIKYEGYSYGFTGTLKFDFVEGTPPRQVVSVNKMWDGSFSYGQTSNPINNHTAAQNFTMPATATYAEVSHIISGHGSDDNTNNCAEFCSKWYRWMVDGNNVQQRNIWRDDCGVNWIYPQSGTWVYNRANWCPGDIVFPIVHKVPATAVANATFSAGMEFQPYTTSNQSNPPSYTTASTLFFYREFSHNIDAGIEDVVAPTKKDLYFRQNPIWSDVLLKVKNYGKNAITSLEVEYGIVGQAMQTETWNGNINAMESAIINLPALAAFKTITGNQQFIATIKSVNSSVDQESHNDTARSEFVAVPKWDKGNFVINMKSSGITQAGNASKWIIRDETGTIVAQRSSTQASTQNNAVQNTDTVHLENGAYSLEVIAEAGYGFKFLNSFIAGWITVKELNSNVYYALPKNDPGNNTNLAGDFGSGFVQEFIVTNSEPLSVRNWNSAIQMSLVPNPANAQVTVMLDGIKEQQGTLTLINALGQKVLQLSATNGQQNIDLSQFAAGIYQLVYSGKEGSKIEKLVITK